jgi:Bacterial dnaA protein helix-turn-helix
MPPHNRLFAVAKQILLDAIDRVVCARLGPARVTGNAQPAVFNRQVAMYLAKHAGGWSTTKIGKFYHGRDHSTFCHTIRRIESMREDNPELDALLSALGRERCKISRSLLIHRSRIRNAMAMTRCSTRVFWTRLADRLANRLLRRLGTGMPQ